MRLETIKTRADFLAVRGGARWATPSFALEARLRRQDAAAGVERAATLPVGRVGLTVTKKLGSSVVRNRIRRRLKAALAELAEGRLRAGCDYVLIARAAALKRPFEDLRADLAVALDNVNRRLERAPVTRKPAERSGSA